MLVRCGDCVRVKFVRRNVISVAKVVVIRENPRIEKVVNFPELSGRNFAVKKKIISPVLGYNCVCGNVKENKKLSL